MIIKKENIREFKNDLGVLEMAYGLLDYESFEEFCNKVMSGEIIVGTFSNHFVVGRAIGRGGVLIFLSNEL